MSNEMTTKFNFEIQSLSQAMDYAKLIADSDLAPAGYKGKPGNVLIAIQYGFEIGLKPMQAIQNIAVINGRPCVWGDAMLALVQNSSVCDYVTEDTNDERGICISKRKDEEKEYIYTFTKKDAEIAGLLKKPGPWQQYPKRMLQMRARAFNLRDKFADVLKGLHMREEVMDYEVIQKDPDEGSRKVQELIKSKSNVISITSTTVSPPIMSDSFSSIIAMIECQNDLPNLEKLKDSIKQLKDDEFVAAKKKYKEKYAALSSSTEKPEEPISEYEKIKNALLKATSRDTLDISADLISQVISEHERKELVEIYTNRLNEFN